MEVTREELLARLNYDAETDSAVRARFLRKPEEICRLAQTAYDGALERLELNWRMPLTRLTVVTELLRQKYGLYQTKGVPESVILDTFRDVSLRANLYRERTGRVGIAKEDVIWFRHIMSGSIFKIGSLQYQPLPMIYLDEETVGEPYMTFSPEQKRRLPAGTPVINCHVQRGADLSDAAVEHSLDEARRFFRDVFPNESYAAFLCYSWLLYPPMTEMMKPDSRIRRFAGRFSVIGACDDSEQALENLFPEGKAACDSGQTALQRLAVTHADRLGYACGVIPLETGGCAFNLSAGVESY